MMDRKKALAVLLFSWASLLLMAAVIPLAMTIGNKWITLIAAAAMMVAAIPVYIAGERREGEQKCLRLLCWTMNASANGLAGAAVYLHGECAVSVSALFEGMLPALGFAVIPCVLLLCFPAGKKPALILSGILAAGILAASLIPAVWPAQPQRSAMFFGTMVAGFYLMAYGLNAGREGRSVLRDVSIASFGALLLMILVVLVIITEGDALDFADLDLRDVLSSRRKKKIL